MTTGLETAVQTLANALDDLESRLESKIRDAAETAELQAAARRQARTARIHTDIAARELGASLSELKSIVDDIDMAEEIGKDQD
jgi:hypothetical protein